MENGKTTITYKNYSIAYYTTRDLITFFLYILVTLDQIQI